MDQSLTYIHPGAQIGQNVKIDPFTTIHKDVVIGDNCWIGSNVTIMDGARIGNDVKIFPGAVISAIPQDLKFKGEHTTLEIGDNTTIRECATLNRGTASRGKTIIGSNCLLMAYVHIGHDCVLKDNIIISNSTNVAGEVEIDDFAIISGAVQIHQFSMIGSHVMISGGSLVRQDVPPYITAARAPLAYAGLNSIGLRRRGFSAEALERIHNVYQIIYQRGLNRKNALAEIHKTLPDSEEKETIVDFLNRSNRGIIKGGNAKE